jgi:hypothetical protein
MEIVVPVHDWTLVEDGVFHDFHTVWISEIRSALNSGLLPKGYYALAEQHTGYAIADILTLHAHPEESHPQATPSDIQSGGTAVATPPRTRRTVAIEPLLERRRSLAIRHVSGHRLIALLEIVSRANKDRAQSVEDFALKAVDSLHSGVHVLVVDLFPPGKNDPDGIHGIIHQRLEKSDRKYDFPAEEPLTLVSYEAAPPKFHGYIEHLKIGDTLPEMPLFLHRDRHISIPLEATYQAAWRGMPGFWRDVLEGRPPQT